MGNSSLSPGLWVQVAPAGAEGRVLSSPRHCSARGPGPRAPWPRWLESAWFPRVRTGRSPLGQALPGLRERKHSETFISDPFIHCFKRTERGRSRPGAPRCNWKLTGSPTTSHLSPERLQSVLQALASVNPHSIPGRGPGVLRTKVPRHREVRPPGRSHTANSGSGGRRAAALPATSTAGLCDSHPRTRDEPPPRQALETSR